MADWEGYYRKLYEKPSFEFEQLPVMARAFGSELIRRCDHLGRLVPGAALDDQLIARLGWHLRAHPGEEPQIRAAVEALLSDDPDPNRAYLVFRDGYLVIRNFFEAQRLSNADRQRRFRERHQGEAEGEAVTERNNVTRRYESNGRNASNAASRESRGVTRVTRVTKESKQASKQEEKSDPSDHLREDAEGGVSEPSAPSQEHAQGLGPDRRIAVVFRHWLAVLSELKFKKPPVLTAERKRIIETRLREFSPEQLCRAIDGVRRSPYHCGQNDTGEVYVDFPAIFRNQTKVEGHIARAEGSGPVRVRPSPEPVADPTRDAQLASMQAYEARNGGGAAAAAGDDEEES